MADTTRNAEALSGVVMGRTAGALLSGDGGTPPATAATSQVDGGKLVGKLLQAQGVEYLFAVNGGHTWPILAVLREHGVKLIHMRHEQSCAYAADGWARTTATPGVCCVTAGCGLTNAVTGLCTAALAGSAVVCIAWYEGGPLVAAGEGAVACAEIETAARLVGIVACHAILLEDRRDFLLEERGVRFLECRLREPEDREERQAQNEAEG